MSPIAELDKGGLRRFGLTLAVAVMLLFGLVFPLWLHVRSPYWPWITGIIFVAWALLAPASMRGFYRLWTRFGLLLNRVTSPFVLGILFYLVITPAAMVIRLRKRGGMALAFDRDKDSYRVPSKKRTRESMERPF